MEPNLLTDLKAKVPGARNILHQLLGCEWGRSLGTEDDREPCQEQAERITVLHLPVDREVEFKLCTRHTARILEETTPHRD
jgi:hypothetical protein